MIYELIRAADVCAAACRQKDEKLLRGGGGLKTDMPDQEEETEKDENKKVAKKITA